MLLYGVVYPNLHVIIARGQQGGGGGASGLTEIFLRRAVLEAAAASIGLSVLTVLLCALVGIPLAFLFERYAFPGRRLFATLAALPLVLPPLVGTVAFIFLCGESGILARVVSWPQSETSAMDIARVDGAAPVSHLYDVPVLLRPDVAGLRRIDAGLAEAARSLGARPLRVLFRVLLPQLAPSLIAAALLTL